MRLSESEKAEIRLRCGEDAFFYRAKDNTRCLEDRRKLSSHVEAIEGELAVEREAVLRLQASLSSAWAQLAGRNPNEASAERRGWVAALCALEAAPGTFLREAGAWLRQQPAAGAAPEPSGAPTEYSDTDSGTLDLVERK